MNNLYKTKSTNQIGLDLHYMVQVTHFIFFPLKWHTSDLKHEHERRKKGHEFRSCQIGIRFPSNVEIICRSLLHTPRC